MDLLTIRSRIAELVGFNQSISNQTTRYNSWINETYKRVASSANWPWLLTHDIVQTSADITTGTVSVNSADTALTFSSGPSVSVANDWMIQFADSDDWYDITAHTAGSTSATMSDGYTGSSNLTAGTYKLRRVFYSLPSNLDRVLSVRQARSDRKLDYVDIREFDGVLPDPTATGDPWIYTMFGMDSSNNWRISFYSTPDSKMNIQVRYYKLITELSSDTDTPIFPSKWHEILIWGALAFYGYTWRDDSRRNESMQNYANLLDDMKRSLKPTTDAVTIIKPWDTRVGRNRANLIPPQFPPDFGRT
jgi:hypothetical protein